MSSQNPWYPGGPIKIAGKLMFIPQTTAISPYGLTQASIKGDPRAGWMHNIPTSSNGYPKSIQYPKPSQEGCCSVLLMLFTCQKKQKKFVSKIPLGTSSLHPEINISGSQMCKRTTWIHRCARGHWAELCRTKGSFFNGAVGRLPRIFMGI